MRYRELARELAALGARTLLDVLLEWVALPRQPQDLDRVSYAPKIRKEQTLVRWEQQTADDVARMWRALGDTVGVQSFLWPDGKRFKLERVVGTRHSVARTPLSQTAFISHCLSKLIFIRLPAICAALGPPGTIALDGQLLAVQCREGQLLLDQVVVQNRKPTSAVDFAHGYLVQQSGSARRLVSALPAAASPAGSDRSAVNR
jgi:methionyl-tRNA formyltransferase